MLTVLVLANFNSIKVQLKQVSVKTSLRESVFQFHKGTIKTPETHPV